MKEQPLASILINNYNYETFLSVSIDSALAQSYQALEVVVVDDGSKDSSRQVIERYGDRIVPVLKPNGGQASAFNAGFAACKGDVVFFLDADDYFQPDKVEKTMASLGEHPTAQWFFHELEDVDRTCSTLTVDRSKLTGPDAVASFQTVIQQGGVLPYMPATSGLVFRRALLSKIFPMPEVFRISADSYLRLAALTLGAGITSARPLATHRIHGSNLYEFRTDVDALEAKVDIKSAYYLAQNFPETRAFCNRLFFHALGKLMALEGSKATWMFSDVQQYIQSLSRLEWLKSFPRLGINFLKTRVQAASVQD
ncbi:MAG: glycosyltransferase [Cyanobacteria bacterium J06621_3]